MAGAGGRWYILACVTADRTQAFSIGVFLFFKTLLPSFTFFLLSAGQRSLGKKEEDLSAPGRRFFTLMLLAVTSAPATTPGLNRPSSASLLIPDHGGCFEHALVNRDVLPTYLHFYFPCASQKCPYLTKHTMHVMQHISKKLMKKICCYITGC